MQEDKGNNKIELNPKSQRIDLHEIISITKINHWQVKHKDKVTIWVKNSKYCPEIVSLVWIIEKETTNVILVDVIKFAFESIKYLISQHDQRAQGYGGLVKVISKERN